MYLTFDDGPDRAWTPAVLAELEHVGARATFFVLGSRLEHCRELVARTLAAGHGVELHAFDHVSHHLAGRERIALDTNRALDALARSGVRPQRWRPPFGAVTDWSSDLAAEFGLELTGWSVDARDWSGESAETLLASATQGLEPSAIVLLHDGVDPGGPRADAAETVRLVEPLVRRVRARGCEPGVLPPPADGPLAAAAEGLTRAGTLAS